MKIIALSLGLLWSFIVQAQQSSQILVAVEYKLTHLIDTTQPDNRFKEQQILLVNQYNSWYDKLPLAYRKMGRTEITGVDVNGVPNSAYTSNNLNAIIKDLSGTGLYTELVYSQVRYGVEDKQPVFNWQITGETSTIGGMNCQQALARYKGRNYIAWFTSSLPYSTGPWKFGGLPGLILEVYDDKKEVEFNFVGFVTADATPRSLGLHKDATRVTAEEYKKVTTALSKNSGAMAGGGGNMVAFNVPAGSALPTPPKPRKNNNPIEKEDTLVNH